MDQDLHFDRCLYDHKHVRAVSAETGISYNDYSRMHLQHRSQAVKRRKGVPEWAMDDVQTRQVILTFLERRYFLKPAGGVSDADRLARIAEHANFYADHRQRVLGERLDEFKASQDQGLLPKRLRELAIEAQIADSRAMFDRRPAELLTSIVYLSYRLGMNSRQVAEQLHILPPAVRILLWRLNRVAEDLQAGRPYRVRRKRGTKLRPWTRRELVQLWFLRANGLSWAKCAVKLGRATNGGHGTVNGSRLIPVFKQHFEREPRAERGARWTRQNLQGLWVLRHVKPRFSWQAIGKVFGVHPSTAMTAYRRHLGKD
jgi:hypothetical protein